MAVKADAAGANDAPKKGDSGSFLAVKSDQPPAAAAAAEPAAPGAADFSAVADAYPGDDAPKEEIAAWMAAKARRSAGSRPSSR